jgi:mono/diheme cytochrome c family protein
MKIRILFHACTLFYSILFTLNVYTAHAQRDSAFFETGEKHFRTLCSSCHSAHQEIYGPMLGSISKKRKESWLIPFIRNSQEVIRSGDAYAKALFEKFDHQIMPPFEQLSDQDIKAILYYLEIESLQPQEYLNDAAIPPTSDSSVIRGKQEFLDHCSMCHFVHKESTFAPALGSVTKRHSREWLISFIQNSEKKINQGDAYAVHLFNQFNQHVMTNMDFLPIEEINAILDYIEFASTVDVAYKGKLNNVEYKKQAAAQIKKVSSHYTIQTLIVFALVLLSVVFILLLLTFYIQVHVYLTNTKK